MAVSEKEIWREILVNYKNLPCLWKPTDDFYNNREVKQKAADSLVSLYKKIDPNATCLTFRKRLENMRMCYSREKKKIRQSLLTELDPQKRYKTTLWYYDLMKFLDKDDQLEKNEWEPLDVEIISEETDINKKRKAEDRIPRENGNGETHHCDKGWEIQGRAIGYSLNELREDQKIIAEKLISDVIFYGKLKRLSDSSLVILSEPQANINYSEKYVNMDAVEYGGNSPTPSNHSQAESVTFISPERNRTENFKPKILIVRSMREEGQI